jgi:hypothetical protein
MIMNKTMTLDQFREMTKDMNGDSKILINFDTDLGSGTDWATTVQKCQDNIMIFC